ncbi:MAG: MATE family efflux transporter [Lachnospiraceae bacterium]|nr:MATE family efflux transporter [Lachnospiraceae bacterium]
MSEQSNEIKKENKMGTMPIGKLLFTMAVPMMLSMLVQALYNIVDSIFVSKIEEAALTAVSMAFPMQNFMIALGAGTGVGINALLSRSLGEKNFERANKAACNGVLLALFNFFICILLGLFVAGPFLRTQSDDTVILNYANDYLSVVMVFSFGLFGQMVFERLLQSTGRTIYSMWTQGLGAIINIILDPVLIFGFAGIPAFGIKGAAMATVIGQCCAMILGLVFNLKFNPDIKLSFKDMSPDFSIIGQIYAVGFPSIIMMSIGSLMTYLMNRILYTFNSTAVAVFGAYSKLQSFFLMPVMDLNNGLTPIVAYNFGAKQKGRLLKAYKTGTLAAVTIMAIGCLIFELIPEVLFKMFSPSAEMLQIGVPALRIIAVHFVVAAFCIITGTMFQALGNGFFSMIVSICRQLVVLIPAAWLLSKTGHVTAVWWSFPIAEVASLAISLVLYKVLYNQKIKNL